MLSKEYFAKLKILKIKKQLLGEMSIDECRSELCENLEEYLDLFWKINEKGFKKMNKKLKKKWTRTNIKDFPVYAVKFEVFQEFKQKTLDVFSKDIPKIQKEIDEKHNSEAILK